MRRKSLLFSVTALVVLLASTAVIATSQAWWPIRYKQEYVGYDFKATFGAVSDVTVDASGAPNSIILEHSVGVIKCNLTIGDKVYIYPDDFDVNVVHHVEFSAITGEGLSRNEGIITFKVPGQPTLTYWGVAHLTNFRTNPDGTFISPQDFRAEGQFILTGTKQLVNVDGFGISDVYFAPPEYTNQYVHQMGFIKGWTR
ncbi:MAG: hypothetical protein ACQCN6_00760 [Candidatus Bathyarchaeia archaeon]|jgi:hypothetical protein